MRCVKLEHKELCMCVHHEMQEKDQREQQELMKKEDELSRELQRVEKSEIRILSMKIPYREKLRNKSKRSLLVH